MFEIQKFKSSLISEKVLNWLHRVLIEVAWACPQKPDVANLALYCTFRASVWGGDFNGSVRVCFACCQPQSMAEVLAKKEELADRLEKANEEAIASAIAEEEQLTREIQAENNELETDNESDFSVSQQPW